jgi:uncharacterized membrane protein
MDALSTETRNLVMVFIRNQSLMIAILAVLYLFSLYVYFFPTPLSAFYEAYVNQQSQEFIT